MLDGFSKTASVPDATVHDERARDHHADGAALRLAGDGIACRKSIIAPLDGTDGIGSELVQPAGHPKGTTLRRA